MKTILLIEDNKGMRENTAEILELENYTVITAENGKIGVEKAQKEKPDLIICDIMMPVLDGYEVLSILSKNPETASIPFIFVTAKADRSDLRKGMEMGADDYLTKPFDDKELFKAINTRFRKVELGKQEFSRTLEGLNDFMTSVNGIEPLKQLSEHKKLRELKKGDLIYKEGSYPKGVSFVVSGKVKTYKTNAEAKDFITGLYKEGDFFGYLALMEDKKHFESAEALDNSTVCIIPKEEFFSIIYSNSEVSKRFIKMLSDNIKEKEDQLIRLAYNSSRKRVAEAIITLADRYKAEDEAQFSMSLSREDIANISGTSYENTIRTLHDFKEEGIINIDKKNITLLNYEKLANMKN